MSLIRKHGAVLQAWACLDLVCFNRTNIFYIFCAKSAMDKATNGHYSMHSVVNQ